MAQTRFTSQLVPLAAEDPLYEVLAACQSDTSKVKIDLGIGAYKDDNGKPWVLPAVSKAEAILRQRLDYNHEYLPISGLKSFTEAASELLLGKDHPSIQQKRLLSIQSVSGTGALYLGALFLATLTPLAKRVANISFPSWSNHSAIFRTAGWSISEYPYLRPCSQEFDLQGTLAAIEASPPDAVFVLHACAHNPTGVDPTPDQWKEIAQALKRKNQLPFFDCAYQGFATGDFDRDAFAIRHFAEQGLEFFVAQSSAKNFGLYGQRVGCLHYIPSSLLSKKESWVTLARVKSQLSSLQRSIISNPPRYGSHIVSLVLNDPELMKEWKNNVLTMSERIGKVRKTLQSEFENRGTPGTWSYITKQVGMFIMLDVRADQVLKLREEYHIYISPNGRVSLGGLNTHNIDHFVRAADRVLKEQVEL
ncbi:unnamed protein product [Clonostachys byssicola]|uniref:Aminotransferase class I/classII large domain-containing protein n=1 Tax=Clonostachys byssicola TaxID=160290 RepID=A0A9N9Y0L7_9HYPO|nr:unnamed protein product [Clonostachys byssicola]